uniref:Phosphoribosylformimino-5-aminoimidazole carboxamide ribotide isomerase n=1 Tax=Salix viminalis TaxID=40686 RepID=A0A6N2LF30_SALVM
MVCVISSLFKDKPLHRKKMILFGLFCCLLVFVLAEKKELCFAEDIPDLLAQLGKFANKVGGGINVNNALSYVEEGASHVIVTSYVFSNGQTDLERLERRFHHPSSDTNHYLSCCGKKWFRNLLRRRSKQTGEYQLALFF